MFLETLTRLLEESFEADALIHEVFVGLGFDKIECQKKQSKMWLIITPPQKKLGDVEASKINSYPFVPPSFDEEKLNEVRDIYKGDIIIGQDLLNIDV